MNQDDFLMRYNLTVEDLVSSGLNWDELINIYNHYLDELSRLEAVSEYIAGILRKVENVHTVKNRVKNPEHLIEKIIRKKLGKPELEFTVETYRTLITDLIGIRVLHLFKADWMSIHKFITDTWETIEQPTANIREGDDSRVISHFEVNGLKINKHPYGYRSLHYVIKFKPDKHEIFAEFQVRTLFEEGWSEIDHSIRYPYAINNVIFGYYLELFNRLAGNADEMGSYVRFLQEELLQIDKVHQSELDEKNATISTLEIKINDLKIDNVEKDALKKTIATLKKQVSDGLQSSITIRQPSEIGVIALGNSTFSTENSAFFSSGTISVSSGSAQINNSNLIKTRNIYGNPTLVQLNNGISDLLRVDMKKRESSQ